MCSNISKSQYTVLATVLFIIYTHSVKGYYPSVSVGFGKVTK